MKKNVWLIILVSIISIKAQSQAYYSSSLEWVFSDAHASNGDDSNSDAISTRLRFSPIISIQNIINYDLSPNVGLFSGFNVRNVGFISNNEFFVAENGDEKQWDRAVRRTYNLGMPLGIKVGNIEKELFVYGGVEAEFAINFRERLYEGDSKNVRSEWFSDEVNIWSPSWFVGVNLPNGIALTYKSYFNNFFNKSYKRSDNSTPYANYNVNVHYISLNFYLFTNFKETYSSKSGAIKIPSEI